MAYFVISPLTLVGLVVWNLTFCLNFGLASVYIGGRSAFLFYFILFGIIILVLSHI